MADQITGIQATVSIDGEAYDVISAQIEEGLDAVPRARLRVAREAALERPAALLGKEKSLGTIAPGYFADIVAVEGDPLTDINIVINNVRWVMKGGAVVVDKTGAASPK